MATIKSIEEKARAYDIALDKIKRLLGSGSNCSREELEYVFPELAESDDERIRKGLIELVQGIYMGCCTEEACKERDMFLAWLEKQSKNNMGISEATKQKLEDGLNKALEKETPESWNKFLDEQGEQKPIDKIVEKARTEKQRVLLTETDGSANIDWDCRSLDDVKILLKCGLEFIRTIESDKQILTDNRFGGCSFRFPTRYDKSIKQGEQKHDNNVEPKFHEGEWIINNEHNNVAKVLEINNEQYRLDYGDTVGTITIALIDNDYHLWTIQDAKPGDVLATENFIFIFKNIDNGNGVHYYCHYEISKHEDDNQFGVALPQSLMGRVGNSISHYSPASKEQRDTLIKAMTDAGYEWDAGNKQLKKIEQNPIDKYKEWYDFIRLFVKQRTDDYTLIPSRDDIHRWGDNILNHARKVLEQNTTVWSKEDENLFRCAIDAVKQESKVRTDGCLDEEIGEMVTNWLKSLKDRVGCEVNCTTTKEWSEEDENRFTNLILLVKCSKENDATKEGFIKFINKLKSLRPQKQWKPSDKLIRVIEAIINNRLFQKRHLDSLYADLKKLKE